ncbi:Clp protease N-terminal domain-containing protein [Streptomyces sp. Amel2xC10]|uniref:Clp protease N-terminal domain-containing protein n=1 Tax=Streptomyces sp. Amel2xC10 TaxID=1305826 RepID=UPI000A082F28|nr:Clp protease N-terminal domain-containing protein [Streptomyces sp. Amel2xC10]SMF54130.1 Clp amino terminal domain-containing protein, pathogenicity island component [Streptomyces sp. Amel2xC10]
MFERFTKDARAVVRGAVDHCAEAGGRTVGAEHLLLALLDREASRASFALAALGLADRKDAVRTALEETRRRAGLSRAETEALAGLGIDVSEIVSRVEEAHGVGAMAGDMPAGVGKAGARRGGRPGFGREAKGVLEQSLRMALARRERHIGDEHLLLAMTVRPGPTAEVLADHGVTHDSLTRVLGGGGEAKAS